MRLSFAKNFLNFPDAVVAVSHVGVAFRHVARERAAVVVVMVDVRRYNKREPEASLAY